MPTKKKPQHLTIKDLCRIYGVGAMTVYNWRRGSTRIAPLPCHRLTVGAGKERHRIKFTESVVTKWAAKHGIVAISR